MGTVVLWEELLRPEAGRQGHRKDYDDQGALRGAAAVGGLTKGDGEKGEGLVAFKRRSRSLRAAILAAALGLFAAGCAAAPDL